MTHELKVKQAQFENALAESLGISVLATRRSRKRTVRPFARFFRNQPTFQVAIPGPKILGQNSRHESNKSPRRTKVRGPRITSKRTMDHRSRHANRQHAKRKSVRGSALHSSRRRQRGLHAPLFHASKHRAGLLRHPGTERSKPALYRPIRSPRECDFEFNGVPFDLAQVVQSVKESPARAPCSSH